MKKAEGRIVSVQGPVVDVQFSSAEDVPNVYGVIFTNTVEGKKVTLEVAEHTPGNIARCIAINSTLNLQRNAPAYAEGTTIEVPVGDEMYARIVNVLGQPIDQKGDIVAKETQPIRQPLLGTKVQPQEKQTQGVEMLQTGLKIIDLLFPLVKGSKTGVLGGAGLGKTVMILEMMSLMIKEQRGTCVFIGVGERIREGNELYFELSKHDILSRMAMIFGQMDESPGARFGVAMSGITIAESIQKKNRDVLLFVDNIFRYVQAGAEISTLFGRIPSETGYQPTLISEASEFHERIRYSATGGGSITSIEAVYVPADDLSDPAVVTIFSFLDSILVLSRERVQLGLYPAIDPLLSSCANLDSDIVGQHHFDIAQEVIRIFQKYDELKRIVMVIGVDELSQVDRVTYDRARKLQNFLTQPFTVAEAYTGKKGQFVSLAQTISGCEKIISGACDRIPEESFYMIGPLDQLGVS